MEKIKIDWVKCPNCGHKLFRQIGGRKFEFEEHPDMSIENGLIEIKCHSCKKISVFKYKKS